MARGDVFTAPIEKGPTRNLTQSSGAHDKWARWSPDGRRIAFISDRDGEEEVYLVDQDGSGEPEQLTDGGSAMRYAPEWSPDGKRLAFSDKDGKLYVLELASRRVDEIADDPWGQIRDYVWSPQGGHLAFSLANDNGFGSIAVWSVGDGELRRVTDDLFNDFNPAWDPAGDFLYYLSDREYAPQISSIEWNFATDRETYVYALALRADVEHPFPVESDEVTIEEEEKEDEAEPEKKGKKKKKDAEGEDEEEKPKEPIVSRLGRARRARRADPGRGRQLRRPGGRRGASADRAAARRSTTDARRTSTTSSTSSRSRTVRPRRWPPTSRAVALSADGKKVLVQPRRRLQDL